MPVNKPTPTTILTFDKVSSSIAFMLDKYKKDQVSFSEPGLFCTYKSSYSESKTNRPKFPGEVLEGGFWRAS
jgi:hypothetical protein